MNKQEEQDIQFQIECLTNELVIMLMTGSYSDIISGVRQKTLS